jgi:hypothetical protein
MAAALAGLGAVALVVTSCGGSGGRPACGPSLNGACLQGGGLFCTEYAGVPDVVLTPIMEQCTEADPDDEPGTWSPDGCPHAGAVGACKEEQSGSCVAVWLYVGDAATGRSMCSAQGGTWVSP